MILQIIQWLFIYLLKPKSMTFLDYDLVTDVYSYIIFYDRTTLLKAIIVHHDGKLSRWMKILMEQVTYNSVKKKNGLTFSTPP